MNKYAKSILNITDKSIKKEHFHTLLGDQDSIPIENLFHAEHFGKTGSIKIKYNDKILEIIGRTIQWEKRSLVGSCHYYKRHHRNRK